MCGTTTWRENLALTNDLCDTVQRNTSIPIPKVLDWSDDAVNSVGSEYIITEHAAGIQLQQKWPYMLGDQKVGFIDAIYKKLREMADINFPADKFIFFHRSNGLFLQSTARWQLLPRAPLWNKVLGLWQPQVLPA